MSRAIYQVDIGTSIWVKESGTPKEYILTRKDQNGCELMRKNLYYFGPSDASFNDNEDSTYENSKVDTNLTTLFLNLFDDSLKAILVSRNISTFAYGDSDYHYISRKCYLYGNSEMGLSDTSALYPETSIIPALMINLQTSNVGSSRVAFEESSSSAVPYILRSPVNSTEIRRINSQTGADAGGIAVTRTDIRIRPVINVSIYTAVSDEGASTINLLPEEHYLSPDDEINQLLNEFKTATFGEEVRDTLIRSIELCYNHILRYALTTTLQGTSISNIILDQNGNLTIETTDPKTGIVTTYDLGNIMGPQGPQGPRGDALSDFGVIIDGELNENSGHAIANSAVVLGLNTKINKISTASSGKVPIINNSGGISSSGKSIGSSTFNSNTYSSSSYIPTEASVRNYAYSKENVDGQMNLLRNSKMDTDSAYTKTQSDNRYVQKSGVSTVVSEDNENPVTSGAVYTAIQEIGAQSIEIDSSLSSTSTNPVQNRAVATALSLKINLQDAWAEIDDAFSHEDPDGRFSDPEFGLFIRRQKKTIPGDVGSTKYDYYLSYSNVDEEAHDIANLSKIFADKNYMCSTVIENNDNYKYYPNVYCMKNYVSQELSKTTFLDQVTEYVIEHIPSASEVEYGN